MIISIACDFWILRVVETVGRLPNRPRWQGR
jgi:hypothetical protein